MATATKSASSTKLVEKFRDVRNEVSDALIERTEEVELLLWCWLAQQHVLFLGPPGVAKSMMIELLRDHVTDLRVFFRLVFLQTPVEEILGPVSLKALEQDVFKRNTSGKLQEAHIAVIDEVFKASSPILNPLLRIINERVWEDNGSTLPVPLHFMACASNELPSSDRDDLQAFRDRLAVTKVVMDVQSDEGFKSILRGQIARSRGEAAAGQNPTVVSLDEYERMRKEVAACDVPEDVLDAAAKLRRLALEAGMYVSARRYGAGIALAQAKATLDGRSICEIPDLTVYQHVLWSDIEDEKTAYKLTLEFASQIEREVARLRDDFEPLAEEVSELRDAVTNNTLDASEVSTRGWAAVKKIGKVRTTAMDVLEEATKDGKDTRVVAELVEQMETGMRWCLAEVIGVTDVDIDALVK